MQGCLHEAALVLVFVLAAVVGPVAGSLVHLHIGSQVQLVQTS